MKEMGFTFYGHDDFTYVPGGIGYRASGHAEAARMAREFMAENDQIGCVGVIDIASEEIVAEHYREVA